MNRAFTLIEIVIVLAIMFVLTTITFGTFIDFRKEQALDKDTELIIEVLREVRNETISSKNASQYGVHFSTSSITVFTGTSYSAGVSTNKVYPLNSTDTIVTITLTGGGNDVVFKRLNGETDQDGTIVVSSPTTSRTKTVTIYKTGLIEN